MVGAVKILKQSSNQMNRSREISIFTFQFSILLVLLAYY